MRKYTDELAREVCQKTVQEVLNQINFPTTTEAGKTLGLLIMMTTRALDALMGPEYATATIMRVMEQMCTGVPQANTKVEIVNRSKLN